MLQRRAGRGERVPALEARPELSIFEAEVWRAYQRLRTTRVNGMGLGWIPWHECLRWAAHAGFDEEDTESLMDLVERLDSEEHKIEAEEVDKKKSKKRKGETDGADS